MKEKNRLVEWIEALENRLFQLELQLEAEVEEPEVEEPEVEELGEVEL